MIRLVSELTNTELLTRIEKLEKYQLKVVENLSKPRNPYEKYLLHKKHEISLVHLAHAVHEAAYRKLITIH